MDWLHPNLECPQPQFGPATTRNALVKTNWLSFFLKTDSVLEVSETAISFILFSPSIINLRYSWKELRWKYLRTLSLVRTHRSAPSHLGSMSSTALIRFAARTQPSCLFRSSQPARRFSPQRESYAGSSATATGSNFSTSVRRAADKDGEGAAPGHGEETFQEFTARYANRLGWPTIRLIHSETFGLRYLQRIG